MLPKYANVFYVLKYVKIWKVKTTLITLNTMIRKDNTKYNIIEFGLNTIYIPIWLLIITFISSLQKHLSGELRKRLYPVYNEENRSRPYTCTKTQSESSQSWKYEYHHRHSRTRSGQLGS